MLNNEKIFELRSKMAEAGIEAYIISDNDQHLSEYISEHWKFREWMSGFTGSRGKLIITEEKAGLWTDSRYFLQAEEQLNETVIKLFREGEPGVPSITDWLTFELMPGNTVGIDGTLFSVEEIRNFNKVLKKADINLNIKNALADEVWISRPEIPENNIFEYPIELSGLSRQEKISLIRQQMKKNYATHYIIGSLDEIAWTLNLRGDDVPYNPVFHAFMIISQKNVNLFINPHKVTAAIGRHLTEEDIKVSLYDDFYRHLKEIPSYDTIFMFDPKRLNAVAGSMLHQQCPKKEITSIISALKAIKNSTEINTIESTMLKDGVAMVELLNWIETTLPNAPITEMDVVKKAKELRAQQEGFKGESFGTIAGYNANGAIVHYSVTKESNATLKPEGLLLIDSGGQYMGGTTDITRTITLGTISEQAKKDYTAVLKGHIALAKTNFPKGTRGVQLDTIARQELWKQGLNYGHGTGHGVGCFLNVHEGPQVLSPQDNNITIEPGMLTSNEPGIYRKDQYGIRIENIVLTVNHDNNDMGEFYKFKTMTLCPIDTQPIIKEMLTTKEIEWLNNYHKTVEQSLSPLLNENLKSWLKLKTAQI